MAVLSHYWELFFFCLLSLLFFSYFIFRNVHTYGADIQYEKKKVLLTMFKIDRFIKKLWNDKLYRGSSSFRWLLAPLILEPEAFIVLIKVNGLY